MTIEDVARQHGTSVKDVRRTVDVLCARFGATESDALEALANMDVQYAEGSRFEKRSE